MAVTETVFDPDLEDLLNRSSLPSMFLEGDSNPTFTDQAGTELSSNEFSHHSYESEDDEVTSQDFLVGLIERKDSHPEGGKTSSRQCLLAGDNGMQQKESLGCS